MLLKAARDNFIVHGGISVGIAVVYVLNILCNSFFQVSLEPTLAWNGITGDYA